MNQIDNKDLERLLYAKVVEANLHLHWDTKYYKEDVNPDALTDKWLDNGTSWQWKVGVYAVIDSNKCDWVHIFIGTQRDSRANPKFVGCITFDNGENDDIGRVIFRAIELMKSIHPVFYPE